MLAIEYHIYIWHASPQLSCGDICQIWMWFEESNMYFCHIENFAYGEINERSLSNPHPRCTSGNIALELQSRDRKVVIYLALELCLFTEHNHCGNTNE